MIGKSLCLILLLITPILGVSKENSVVSDKHYAINSAHIEFNTINEYLELYLGREKNAITVYKLIGGELNLPINKFEGTPPDFILLSVGRGSNWWKYYYKPFLGEIPEGVSLLVHYSANVDKREAFSYSMGIRNALSKTLNVSLMPMLAPFRYSGNIFAFYSPYGVVKISHFLINNFLNSSNSMNLKTIIEGVLELPYYRLVIGYVRDFYDLNNNGRYREYIPFIFVLKPIKDFLVLNNDTFYFSLKRALGLPQIKPCPNANISIIEISIGAPIYYISGVKPNNTGFEFSGNLVYLLKRENLEKSYEDINMVFGFANLTALIKNIPEMTLDFSLEYIKLSNFYINTPKGNLTFLNASYLTEIKNHAPFTSYNNILVFPIPPKLGLLYNELKKRGIIDSWSDVVKLNVTNWKIVPLEPFGIQGYGILVKLGDIPPEAGETITLELLLPNIPRQKIFVLSIGPFLVYYPQNISKIEKAFITIGNGIIFDKNGSYIVLRARANTSLLLGENRVETNVTIENSGLTDLKMGQLNLIFSNQYSLFIHKRYKVLNTTELSQFNLNGNISFQNIISDRIYPGKWIIGYKVDVLIDEYNNVTVPVFSNLNQLISININKDTVNRIVKDGFIENYPIINVTKNVNLINDTGTVIVKIDIKNLGTTFSKVVIFESLLLDLVDRNKGKNGFLTFIIRFNNRTILKGLEALSKHAYIDKVLNTVYIRSGLIGLAPNDTLSIIYAFYLNRTFSSTGVSKSALETPVYYLYKFDRPIMIRETGLPAVFKTKSSKESLGKYAIFLNSFDQLIVDSGDDYIPGYSSKTNISTSGIKVNIKGVFLVYVPAIIIIFSIIAVVILIRVKRRYGEMW